MRPTLAEAAADLTAFGASAGPETNTLQVGRASAVHRSMSIGAISAVSARGLDLASSRVSGAAAKVASPESDPVSDTVVLAGARVQMAAAVAVSRAADAMVGTLVDMLI
jgi:hypothetical protein